jgi:hypothetical protein
MVAAQGKNWALGAAALVASSTRLPHYSANTISNRDYTLGCFLSRPPRRAVRKSRPAARRCNVAGISHVRSRTDLAAAERRYLIIILHTERRTHCVCVLVNRRRSRPKDGSDAALRGTRTFQATRGLADPREKERLVPTSRHQGEREQQSVHRRHNFLYFCCSV